MTSRSQGFASNNSMQQTALRAAADAERYQLSPTWKDAMYPVTWRRLAFFLILVLSPSCSRDGLHEAALCPIFNPPGPDSAPFPMGIGDSWSYVGTWEGVDSNGGSSGTESLSVAVEASCGYAGRTFWQLKGPRSPLPDLLRLEDNQVLAVWSGDTLPEPPVLEWSPFWNARRQSLPWRLFDFSADSGSVVVLFTTTWQGGAMRYRVVNHGYSPMLIASHPLPKVFHFELDYDATAVAPYDQESETDHFYIAPGIGIVRHTTEWHYRGSFNSNGIQRLDLRGCEL